MLNIKTFIFNPFQENCYLAWDDSGEGVVIDPGCYDEAELQSFREYLSSEGVRLKAIWLTHGHFDHVFGVAALQKELSLPVLMAPEDKEILEKDHVMTSIFGLRSPEVDFLTTDIKDGDELFCGSTSFKVIATPGHTPGGVCFYSEQAEVIFTGDTLFAGSIGRTDMIGGDYDRLIVSVMDNVMGLPGPTDVLPGHGPKSSISDERTHNPFLQPFNEPEEEGLDWDEDGIELSGGEL